MMITAEPLPLPPPEDSKTVRVGISSQALPLASGASPGHRRMVWIPRKSLLLPAAAQDSFCACAAVQASNAAVMNANNCFNLYTSPLFARIIAKPPCALGSSPRTARSALLPARIHSGQSSRLHREAAPAGHLRDKAPG